MQRSAAWGAALMLALVVSAAGIATLVKAQGPGATAAAPIAEPPVSAAPGGQDGACVPASLEERAARVLVVGLPGVTASSEPIVTEVLDVGVGGVLVTEPNVVSSAQMSQLVSDLRALAGRPLLVSAGEESGRVATFRDVFGATPSARTLAARSTPSQVEEIAGEIGSKLAALGIDLDFAPVVDLDAGPAGGIIGDRSFSAEPAEAAEYGLAWARGLAGAGVHPTAKHFPGHGRVIADTHLELPLVDAGLDELRESDLVPFVELIDAGVPVIMLDHIAYRVFDPDLPASLSPKAYAFLRELGFEGVAITDSVGMGAVNLRWPFPEAAVLAISAGADAVLTTDGTQALGMRDALVEAVRSGRLPESRLDEAAGRMAALAGDDSQTLVCRSIELPALTPTSPGG
ncbi:MAG: hypothetical protein KY450_10830 [Actinobacteria bacterium]|nr:hypothetical protein [Actinomycetota bacterium]